MIGLESDYKENNSITIPTASLRKIEEKEKNNKIGNLSGATLYNASRDISPFKF